LRSGKERQPLFLQQGRKGEEGGTCWPLPSKKKGGENSLTRDGKKGDLRLFNFPGRKERKGEGDEKGTLPEIWHRINQKKKEKVPCNRPMLEETKRGGKVFLFIFERKKEEGRK